ncbi:MAG: hypothetical protein DVB26_03755 [Verrucomicrobia bacterium]|nr:MAG: hypothetical protein DVB26_03755 [Verrucomicrobiota bacterium]
MALAEPWHLRSRSRECAATQRPFVAGEPIITALFPDPESSGYLRRDYCLDAWGAIPAAAERPFSSWRTSYAAPGGDKPQVVDREQPEDILRRMVEDDQDHTENTRYILAVMLERKRILRETDTQRTATGILRIYENRKTGEVYIVKDPDIPLSQVDALQQEVLLLLEANSRPPSDPSDEEPLPPPAAAI